MDLLSLFKDSENYYRDLVQEQMRKLSESDLWKAGIFEISNLPKEFQPYAEGFIDKLNTEYGYDKEFWMSLKVSDAFDKILKIALDYFPFTEDVDSVTNMYDEEYQEVAFSIFQIITLGFAYSACSQKKQRIFMGIKKGIFT